jgi:hypothetical protein
MSRRKRAATADVAAPAVRQLPAKASLALERKRAKTLLRELHAGERSEATAGRASRPCRSAAEHRWLAALSLLMLRSSSPAVWIHELATLRLLRRSRGVSRHSPGSLHGPPEPGRLEW